MEPQRGSPIEIHRRVLVTGGCGFIGRHLASKLAASGCEVAIVDDLSTGSRDLFGERPSSLRCYEGSVTDLPFLQSVFQAFRPQLIFHLASLVGLKLTTRRPRETYDVSVTGAANLLRLMRDTPMVLFSSSAVYGRECRALDAEELRSAALDYDGGVPGYASGKLAAERMCAAAAGPVLMVRPFNVVGPGQSDRYGMVMPAFIRRAMAGDPLIVYDDGRQERTFAGVDAFLDALWRLIASPAAWISRRAYDLGSNRAISILDLARLVGRTCECEITIEHRPYAEAFPGKTDVRRRLPRLDAVQALIGALEWPPIEQIVRELMAHHRTVGAHCLS
jgi:UDP-glucose 4-epimerase